MKRQNVINLIVVLIIGLATTVIAGSFDPGSEQDPVVTKGYVDSQISEVKKTIETSQSTSTRETYEPLKINKNVQVIGKQGTEMIVRAGETKAITYIKDGNESGLQDVTDGIDIMKDKKVPLNHLIIIPRDDGRGIKFDTDGYIMIRGQYTIK